MGIWLLALLIFGVTILWSFRTVALKSFMKGRGGFGDGVNISQLQASQAMLGCVTTESYHLCEEKVFRRTGKKDTQQPTKEP